MDLQSSPADAVERTENASVDAVIRVFQPRIAEPISRDRAGAMQSNLFGFFRTLLDWKHDDDEAVFRAGGAK